MLAWQQGRREARLGGAMMHARCACDALRRVTPAGRAIPVSWLRTLQAAATPLHTCSSSGLSSLSASARLLARAASAERASKDVLAAWASADDSTAPDTSLNAFCMFSGS